MVFSKRVFSSIYRERNRFKTIYLEFICSEKVLQNLRKRSAKTDQKTDFRIAQKRKEPLGFCRLGGRPGRSTASSAGKEPLARVDRSGRPSKEENIVLFGRSTGAIDSENPRATAYSRSTRAVDRQTCTNVHVLELAPVDRAGRPVSLK